VPLHIHEHVLTNALFRRSVRSTGLAPHSLDNKAVSSESNKSDTIDRIISSMKDDGLVPLAVLHTELSRLVSQENPCLERNHAHTNHGEKEDTTREPEHFLVAHFPCVSPPAQSTRTYQPTSDLTERNTRKVNPDIY
jgi:hypothetical protein